MPKKATFKIGQKFGSLAYTRSLNERSPRGESLHEFLCDCGKLKALAAASVLSDGIKSCGCKHYEVQTKHALSGHVLYKTWGSMVQRCTNPNSTRFSRYGGRGITIHKEWRESPEKFIRYCISIGWATGLTLDRIDNDGNYEPGNVRFVTMRENLLNRKPTEKQLEASSRKRTEMNKSRSKPVRCIDTGAAFPSATAASRSIGKSIQNLCKAIKRKGRCGGLLWEYIDE